MHHDTTEVETILQWLDQFWQQFGELSASQQALLDELSQVIRTTLTVIEAPPDRQSAWKETLAHVREAFEEHGQTDFRGESTLASALEETVDETTISRTIGMARIPDDVLSALLANRYLDAAVRIAIVVFDRPWEETAPGSVTVLAGWPDLDQADAHFDLEDGTLLDLFWRGSPTVIEDARQNERFNQMPSALFDRDRAVGLVLYPLVAGGKRYGTLVVNYGEPIDGSLIPHVHGLFDQAAVAIYTMLLLEAEARARQQAEKANDHKLKLLATISHEMRTPLTSIKGFATTLLADDVEWEPDSQRDFIETINQEADKLTELIEHLLSHSRLESGTLTMVRKIQPVDDIISIAMAQFQTLTANHNLVVDIPESLPSVYADPRRIAQVLTNLVNNAVKYAPPQTDVIVTASSPQPGYVQIDISDQGPGIPEEERMIAFEAFQRGSRAKETHKKGAGLGLAICKGIVEAHDGEIWIQDRSEPGTTISFTLPVSNSGES